MAFLPGTTYRDNWDKVDNRFSDVPHYHAFCAGVGQLPQPRLSRL